jgi:hypothetical protein
MDARGVIFIVVPREIRRYASFSACPSMTVNIFQSFYVVGCGLWVLFFMVFNPWMAILSTNSHLNANKHYDISFIGFNITSKQVKYILEIIVIFVQTF